MVWADGEGDSPPLMASPAASTGADSPPVLAPGAYEQDWLTPVPAQQQGEEGEAGAPLVDPFSPTFQARMLSCLEPAVSEVGGLGGWVGAAGSRAGCMHCCSETASLSASLPTPPCCCCTAPVLHLIPMLYCLQWPGVYCMTAEEEEAAEAGLKAAGRATWGLVELQLCGLEFAVRWVWWGAPAWLALARSAVAVLQHLRLLAALQRLGTGRQCGGRCCR